MYAAQIESMKGREPLAEKYQAFGRIYIFCCVVRCMNSMKASSRPRGYTSTTWQPLRGFHEKKTSDDDADEDHDGVEKPRERVKAENEVEVQLARPW